MIPTAEEFLNNSNNINYKELVFPNPHLDILPFIEVDLIEFAKLHVEEALQKAYENADLEYYGDEVCYNKDSILNAYPIENIK